MCCRLYVFVAWVWSIVWYLALDPLRWGVSWVLNENGVRNRATWRREQVPLTAMPAALSQDLQQRSIPTCRTAGSPTAAARAAQRSLGAACSRAGRGLRRCDELLWLPQDAARKYLGVNPAENVGPAGMGEITSHNPLGRGGAYFPTADELRHAAVVFVRNLDTSNMEEVYIQQ